MGQPKLCRIMDAHGETTPTPSDLFDTETFNPWSIVNLVFHHLAEEGLHPVLGEAGDPGAPAADLLRALGITPAAEGNRRIRAAQAASRGDPGRVRHVSC